MLKDRLALSITVIGSPDLTARQGSFPKAKGNDDPSFLLLLEQLASLSNIHRVTVYDREFAITAANILMRPFTFWTIYNGDHVQ